MKRFLFYIALFSILLLSLWSGYEYSLRQIPNVYVFKKCLLETKGNQMKNIIIGSSTVACSIDPVILYGDSTYNLAIAGQWIRCNEMVLEKYIDSFPNLDCVIWGISYLTLWSDDSEEGIRFHDYKGNDNITYNKIYMDISLENGWKYHSELLGIGRYSFRKWSKYYLSHGETVHCDSLGVDHNYDLSFKIKDRRKWVEKVNTGAKRNTALKNIKAERVYKENISRMHKAAKLCYDREIRLCIVVPPVYSLFNELTDKEQLEQMYAAIREVARTWDNVSWYDYHNDERFSEDDFFDGVHLTSDVGAIKFSKILRKDIFGKD